MKWKPLCSSVLTLVFVFISISEAVFAEATMEYNYYNPEVLSSRGTIPLSLSNSKLIVLAHLTPVSGATLIDVMGNNSKVYSKIQFRIGSNLGVSNNYLSSNARICINQTIKLSSLSASKCADFKSTIPVLGSFSTSTCSSFRPYGVDFLDCDPSVSSLDDVKSKIAASSYFDNKMPPYVHSICNEKGVCVIRNKFICDKNCSISSINGLKKLSEDSFRTVRLGSANLTATCKIDCIVFTDDPGIYFKPSRPAYGYFDSVFSTLYNTSATDSDVVISKTFTIDVVPRIEGPKLVLVRSIINPSNGKIYLKVTINNTGDSVAFIESVWHNDLLEKISVPRKVAPGEEKDIVLVLEDRPKTAKLDVLTIEYSTDSVTCSGQMRYSGTFEIKKL